jgi:hypothetical protein
VAGLRSWYVPIALFVFSLAAYTGMLSMQVRHGNLGTTQVSEFLLWFGLAFAAYAAAVFWLERRPHEDSREVSSSRTGIKSFYLLVWI